MKYLLILILAVSCKGESQTANQDDTTYYLIRHAEKDRSNSAGNDPNLNAKGQERALEWKNRLQDKGIDAIYTTNLNRTRQTAQPLAEHLKITPKTYDATNLYASEFKTETRGKTVLIVGHSNTTPAFVNAILGEQRYSDLDDANNGALFKVTFKSGKPQVSLQQFEEGFRQ